MKSAKGMKVYFASPWFNPEQAEREDRVKNKLKSLGFDVFSPKDNCNLSPISDKDVREKVFGDNVRNIASSDMIFAITDGKDMGTIWEAGYAYALKRLFDRDKKIVYYCETLGPNGQFNLMLAQSGDIVIKNFEDLDKLPKMIENDEVLEYVGIIE